MAKEYSRTQRVADQMQRELAHAKIFITLMGDASDEDIALNLAALKDAAGFLRVHLGRVMKLRSIPQLHFHYDESVRRGVHLSSLIERAVAQDRQRSEDGEE